MLDVARPDHKKPCAGDYRDIIVHYRSYWKARTEPVTDFPIPVIGPTPHDLFRKMHGRSSARTVRHWGSRQHHSSHEAEHRAGPGGDNFYGYDAGKREWAHEAGRSP